MSEPSPARAEFERIEQLFLAALDRPEPDRGAFLDHACQGQTELRREVETLLRADARAAHRVGGLIDRAAEDWLAPDPAAETAAGAGAEPATVGPYRLRRRLGRGGQGTVYLGERQGDGFDHLAAIKLLDTGLETLMGTEDGHAATRFRLERRILATLEHPGIARFLDGGSTEHGRLWVALEYVDGEPIDRYCETLGLGARLALFCEAAEAVSAAHRQLVVHRDIKPSNLLVTQTGQPKLLDFGIAKLLLPNDAAPQATSTHERRLTPEYASPEQLAGLPLTTATDVYSLGVLLYRLLTGTVPHDRATCAAVAMGAEAPEVERPSSRVRRRGQAPGTHDPTRYARRLAGDLDQIVVHATHPQPQDRYASVDALIDDLRRYRVGLPVAARRGTRFYAVGKFLHRHRLTLAAVALVAISALASFFAHVRQLQAERDRATAVEAFFTDLLAAADPNFARGDELTVLELVERAGQDLDRFDGQPAIRATLAELIGETLHTLGDYDAARRLFEGAIELRRDLGEPEALVGGLHTLGLLLVDSSQREEGAELNREAYELALETWGREHLVTASATAGLAHALYYLGEFERAEALYRQTLETRERLLGPEHPDVAESYMGLSVSVFRLGEKERSIDLQRRALEILLAAHGETNTEVATAMNNLAAALEAPEQLEEAEALAARSFEIHRALRRGPSLDEGISLHTWGKLREDQGNFEGAHELYLRAVQITEEMGGPEHETLPLILADLGKIQLELGDPAQAERTWRRGLAIAEAAPKPEWRIGALLQHLGELYASTGRAAEAEPLLRLALEHRSRAKPTHWRIADAQSALGGCLAALGRIDEARILLEGSAEVLRLAAHERRTVGRLAATDRADARLRRLDSGAP